MTIVVGKNFRGHLIVHHHFTDEEMMLRFWKVKQQVEPWLEMGLLDSKNLICANGHASEAP